MTMYRWLLDAIPQFSVPPDEEQNARSEFIDEASSALAHLLEQAPKITIGLVSSETGPIYFYQWESEVPQPEILGPAARFLRFRQVMDETMPVSKIILRRAMRLLPAGNTRVLATRPTADLSIASLGTAVNGQPLLVPRVAPLELPKRTRWQHVLAHLMKSRGAVTIRVRRRRPPLPHEADYVRLVSELDHSGRSGPASEETWRTRNPLFSALLDDPVVYELDIGFDGDNLAGLYAAITADTECRSFSADELPGQHGPYRPTDPPETLELLQRLRSLYSHDEIVQLLLPPFSFTHALSSQPHFTPAPFVIPPVPGPRSDCHMLVIGRLSNGQLVAVPLDYLPRGLFATGTVGSGKTVTAQSIVLQAENAGVPIFIIDPIKREWEALLGKVQHPLEVIDFSSDRFLMTNPFIPAPGMTLAGYIEPLAGILSMTGPTTPTAREYLSYIVRRLYEWKLGEGQHDLLSITGADLLAEPQKAPTFDDFLTYGPQFIRELVNEESSQDARETAEYFSRRAEMVRGSFLHAIFTPPPEVPAQTVFSMFEENYLIELVRIPDEMQRATLYALLALQLTHYRLTTPNVGGGPQQLVVLEESHNVLGTDFQKYDSEIGQSPAEIAVRLLKNQLAELRASGTGLFLIDQSASRLVPDALINTSTRFVHNVSFGDDRKALATALGLSPAQERFLNRLRVGEAIVSTPDLPPCLVAVRASP